jgi:hypothetical protein
VIKILLRVAGVLIALGGVAAAWVGSERHRYAEQVGQNIYVERSQMANPGAGAARKEAGEKKIAEWEQEIEETKTETYLWFGGAAAALVVGVSMALLPSTRKRKVSVPKQAPAQNPPQNQDAPAV